jgi:non-ribosomal peptide synthetase component E (peptide arylation enzyme)
MTEISISFSKSNEYKIDDSVGSTLFSNALVKIVDEDGNALEVGETGEICAKSGFKFMVSLII